MIVYIIADEDIVKYVGKTTRDIRPRMSLHITDMDSKVGQFIRNHQNLKRLSVVCYEIDDETDLGIEKNLVHRALL